MEIEGLRPFLVPLETAGPKAPDLTGAPPRVPTGVPDFDFLTGGMPVGSVVLLLGEAGAGHQEFALTSAVHLMMHYDDPRLHQFYIGSAKGPFVYPAGISYISTSRSKEDVLNELKGSFSGVWPEVLDRHLRFADLSPAYFRDSVVPTSWATLPGPLLGGSPPSNGGSGASDTTLRALATAFETGGPQNLVIFDSLTDLVVRDGIPSGDLLAMLKGLRRKAKEWGGLVYILLTEGVAPLATQNAVIDSVDGVLQFRWSTTPNFSHRQRSMLVPKFMPILSRLPAEYHGRFIIRVSAKNGLVTTQYERI
jgi:KaiC/GvpD/RAD55 family RecA-like ATPase